MDKIFFTVRLRFLHKKSVGQPGKCHPGGEKQAISL